MLGLRGKYGCERLEAACTRAFQVGDPAYRTIKGILTVGTQHADQPTSGAATTALLCGPEQFGTAGSDGII